MVISANSLYTGCREETPSFDPDEAILADYQWDEYKGLSPAMGEAVEAHVLKEVIQGPDSTLLSRNTLTVDHCQRLLRNDRNFRRLFLHCWEIGCFDEVRRDERCISLTQSTTSTPSVGSWKLDTTSNQVGEDGFYLNNTLTPATSSFSNNENVTINDGVFSNVEGDLWQINYFNDRHKDVADWLSLLDHRPTHNEVAKQREKNTGEWFPHSAEFRNWLLLQGHGILWCPGIPGVGKTVLASIAINYLQRHEAGSVLTFVYFDYKQQKQQNPLVILGSLARQIYEGVFDSEEASVFEALYQSHRAKKDSATLEELRKTIALSLTQYRTAFIVLDALDEYLETYNDHKIRELLVLLLSLGRNVKLLITSRVLGEIEKIFQEFGCIRRPLHAFDDDIQNYIEARIISGSFGLLPSPSLSEQITGVVTKAAKGRFLLARLHMNSLVQHSNPGDMRDALESLPDGIDETYAEAIVRIRGQTHHRRELAMKTLMWVAYARRSLSVEELQHALATRPGAASTEDYLTDPSFITAACAGLVIVEDGSIRFVHVTVQEYFSENRHQHFPFAEEKITRTCIDYLSLTCFNIQQAFDWGDHPFYDYAALEWGNHAQACDQGLDDHILHILTLENPALGLSLEYVLYRDIFDWYCDDGPGSHGCGVFLAIYHSQNRTLSTLMNNLHQLPLTREGRTPFIFAARLGRVESIKLLLERQKVAQKLELGIPDGSGRSPLLYAAGGGHEEVVKLLLECEWIDVDAPDFKGTTPLLEAAAKNHVQVVKLLLKQTRIPNARDYQGSTPLILAARAGNVTVVETLLSDGRVNVDASDKEGRTALSHVAEQGFDDVARLLLATGEVDVNSQDNSGRTVLSRAAGNWSSNQQLVKRNSPLDAGQKPQARAVSLVKMLLEDEGLDLNLADKRGWTPFQYASRMGYSGVMKLLKDEGAKA